MIVYLHEPGLHAVLDADARIVAMGKLSCGRVADGAVVARGMISTAWTPSFDGEWLEIDFYGLVHLEAWLTRRHPHYGADAIRRRLRSLVKDGGFMTDMLRLLDAALAHEWTEPVGELAWLAEQVRTSCIHGHVAAGVRRIAHESAEHHRTVSESG